MSVCFLHVIIRIATMDEDDYVRKEKRRQQKAKWAQKKREALRICSILEKVRRGPFNYDTPGTARMPVDIVRKQPVASKFWYKFLVNN